MDESSHGGSSSLPPFLTKTYEMVDDDSSDSVVSWSENNKSFIVKNPAEFSRDLLPRFFKHKNFSSFIRQLNTYGFRKVDPEKWEFSNDDFVRGRPYLMKNIHRRKPVHSHSLVNLQTQNPLTESERRSMEDQIERLKREKEGLLVELQSQEQERKDFEMQVTTLKDRLQQMEQHQKSIVAYVSQVLGKPGLSLNLENHEIRKRRVPESSLPSSRSHVEQVENLESSLTFWENLVSESYEKSGVQSSSSMDLDAAESSLSMGDTRPKSSKIDMNLEPPVTVTVAVAAPKAGVNDDFWEQCLTENPGSTEQQEVQSERKDVDNDNGDNKIGNQRTFWWNSGNVNNNITKKT
ncbi:PREDICTED: heat stress transcription factor A-4c-like [Camelina sativa]|uniref:Heat stress transcription factor A-4c-like n=1 Tax=Camelina sativa TaxID=90675 RepID=A0ABM0X6N8_CAMSA|nr:PREDICTED: heat stress transcription factor A-4c-like [Camelina sativa]XP_010481539.1 PREDICTED: heat stress transcription factor A-4c-like [Camelina sativa]XP_019095707.1 PREDICTED: heat stress transcription factor A-4c-like [Camelina sativa]